MDKFNEWWINTSFAKKNPKIAEWVLKGGLFIIISNLVTVFKAFLLGILPFVIWDAIGAQEWLWPNIPVNFMGVGFNLSIIGNALETVKDSAGEFVRGTGLAFTLGNLATIVIGEIINFPMQRNITFRSKGPVVPQILVHGAATIAVFLIMNLFTCVWNPITIALISNEALRTTVQSIVTTVVTGGVAMVIIFAVDNKIFAPGWGEKK